MAIITLSEEDFRNPEDSKTTLVSVEDAGHCDGSECGQKWELDGELHELGPHFHVWMSGVEPTTKKCIEFPVVTGPFTPCPFSFL